MFYQERLERRPIDREVILTPVAFIQLLGTDRKTWSDKTKVFVDTGSDPLILHKSICDRVGWEEKIFGVIKRRLDGEQGYYIFSEVKIGDYTLPKPTLVFCSEEPIRLEEGGILGLHALQQARECRINFRDETFRLEI